jgi:hypothetical protein
VALLQLTSKLLENGGEFFAVSAPGSIELDEEVRMVLQYLREVAFVELENQLAGVD